MIKYNKLIRDKVPTIMSSKEKNFSTHIASEEEYKEKLKEKLLEEVNEFLERPCLEELADVQEVLNAIAYGMKITADELLREMFEKSITHGIFKDKIILEWVEK
tara:strand:- start:201 stop:512 length:312 start_codon:yes stop_codon:yes gene_type:complete